ncbi:MAG: amidohydrolase [Faecalibacterium sp.]|nr:amidohydrolase [Faecalibacterium sp.]
MNLLPGMAELQPQVSAWRRDIHAHPELGFREVRTSALIQKELRAMGLEVITNFCEADTAVIGVLKGKQPGPVIGLRADIDALPMQDEKDESVPYRSQNPGVCHACGHDSHTAALLGTALWFSQNRDKVRGTVKFVFQPAEEGPAPGGAKKIMESGILSDVNYMLGAHQTTSVPPGVIMTRSGVVTASGDFFDIVIEGTGAHGASPHCGTDVVVAASQTVVALQSIVSRRLDPMQPAVLSVCSMQAGEPGTKNVLPAKATLSGTVRTFDETVREEIFALMEQTVQSVCAIYGCTGTLDRQPMFPSLSNNEEVAQVVLAAAREVVGEQNTFVIPQPSTGSEDFAWYARSIPAAFYMFGARPAEGPVYSGHHPKFDLNEDALPVTMSVMAASAIKLMQQHKEK